MLRTVQSSQRKYMRSQSPFAGRCASGEASRRERSAIARRRSEEELSEHAYSFEKRDDDVGFPARCASGESKGKCARRLQLLGATVAHGAR
jgi:hypothetical protein